MRILLCFCLALLLSCSQQVDIEELKNDVEATEVAFAKMAAERGLGEAFEYYAAPDGVINRRRTVIQGKSAIRQYYDDQPDDGAALDWSPSFVDVAASGELAYTYGPYTFTYTDSLGNPVESKGIFHTVWRLQPDGTWRFVWD
ncbi:MAG: nuclear transport factor 2 family protein [Cyclobacteriaceae bacterium]